MEPNKILKSDILDLLFEHRNKEYGAYELRRSYNKRIRLALIITTAIALIVTLSSFLADKFMPAAVQEEKEEVVLAKVQDEPKPEPPPPPPPKREPPPQVKMEKFTPIKIEPDKDVKKEDLPPKVDTVSKANIGLEKQKGLDATDDLGPKEDPKGVMDPPKDDTNYDQTFTKVEVDAEFPGGNSAWTKYLQRNLRNDLDAPPGTYRVVVQFIVDKEGNISDVKALTNFGHGMEEEAIRAIKKGPKWIPAIQNGRQVKAYRSQPITFTFGEE